jgi:hypothetical protein
MGFSISWIGLKVSKSRALELLGFRDTGELDEANEAPFSAAGLPNGWTIIWSNDFDYASHPDVTRHSLTEPMVGCHVEEHVMFSSCHNAENGDFLWNVCHDAQEGIYDIHSTGATPVEFDAIVAQQRAEQDRAGGEAADVDHIFDAPIKLAAAITGYRHDRWSYDWGEPQFTVIEPKG